jgi:hypothetical protein
MERIIWSGVVRNAEVLQKVKGERNGLQKTKAISIGQILHGNCLLKRIIEGRMEEYN